MVVDGFAYVATADAIAKVSLDGGVVTVLAGQPGSTSGSCSALNSSAGANVVFCFIESLTTDGEYLYSVSQLSSSNGAQVVRRTSLATGATATLGLASSSYWRSLVVGEDGDLFLTTGNLSFGSNNQVLRVDPVTGASSLVASFTNGRALGIAADGDDLFVVVRDGSGGETIQRVDPATGSSTTVATDSSLDAGELYAAGGFLYAGRAGSPALARYKVSDGQRTVLAGASPGHLDGTGTDAWFGAVTAVGGDGSGLVVVDQTNHRLRAVAEGDELPFGQLPAVGNAVPVLNGQASVLAGSGSSVTSPGTGTGASFKTPSAVVVVGRYAYVGAADAIMKVSLADGASSVLAGQPGGTGSCQAQDAPVGANVKFCQVVSLTSDGHYLYSVTLQTNGTGERVVRRTSLATGATSTLGFPASQSWRSLAVGADGYLYVTSGNSDLGSYGRQVRRVDRVTGDSAVLLTVPAGHKAFGIAADAHWLYLVVRANSSPNPVTLWRVDPADGSPTTLVSDSSIGTGGLLVAGPVLYVSAGSNDGSIKAFPAQGGPGTTIVAGPERVAQVGSDGLDLYAVTSDGNRLRRIIDVPPPAVPDEQTFGQGCPCGTTLAMADPVNTATGAFFEQLTDATLPGAGVTFGFTRTYNSNDATVGRLGPGWTDPYQAELRIPAPTADVTLRTEDGAQVVYSRNGDGTFTAPPGIRATLAAVTGGYEVSTPDRRTSMFDTAGRLTGIRDAHGEGLSFGWTGADLTTVTDAAGRQVTFTYGTDTLLDRLDLPDGRHVDYGYTAGRLTSVTDLGGQVWSYGYGTAGRLTTVTDPRNHVITTNVYDSTSGRVTQQSDGVGNDTFFDWDPGTETATTTTPDGGEWVDVYAGNVALSRTDPLGHTTRFRYNSDLRLVGVQDPTGNTTSYSYDQAGNRLSATDPLGNTTSWTYDTDNNPTLVTDPLGNSTELDYNSAGDLIERTSPLGAVTTWTYNSDGTLATMVDPRGHQPGNDPADYTTSYAYDPDANLEEITSPLGHTTTVGHDAAGRPTSVTDPRGNEPGNDPADYTTVTAYSDRDQVLQVSDPLGHTTTNGYDDAGNLTSVTDALHNITSYGYDDANRRVSVTDPLAHTTTVELDWAGRVTATEDADGNRTTAAYDDAGRLVETVSARGNAPGATAADFTSSYSYDARGNPTSASRPLPGGATATVNTRYDGANRPVTITDPGGNTTGYRYDRAGRVVATTDPLGNTRTTSYNQDGRVEVVTDGNQQQTSYSYNPAGAVTARTDPLQRSTTWTYDRDGVVATATSPDELTSSYDHDPAGNLIAIDYSDPATADIGYGYDPAGRRTDMTDATGATSYSYDDAGRVIAVTDGHGDTVGYGYDAADRLTSLDYPGPGRVATYTYTDAGRLDTLTDWAARQTSFGYNPDGQLTGLDYPNGVDTDQTYDIAGRLTTSTAATSTDPVLDLAYTYNTRGLLTGTDTTFSGPSATTGYTWDDNSRLDTSTDGDFTFDPADQLTRQHATTSATAEFDASGQLTDTDDGTTTTSYDYDPRGNRTTAIPATGAPTDYGYTQDNQLASYQRGGTDVAYTYNGDGLRTSATTGTGPAAVTETFTWDTASPLPLLLQDGHHTYLYGPDNTPIAQIDTTTGDIQYLHHDLNGSTRALTDDTGQTTATTTYSPYGTLTATTGTGTSRFGYAGEYTEPDTGLIYLRARHYDPATGQFLSRDPLEDTTRAPYGYTGGNPLQYTDAAGLDWTDPFTSSARHGYDLVAGAGMGVVTAAQQTLELGEMVPGSGLWAAHQLGYDTPDAVGWLGAQQNGWLGVCTNSRSYKAGNWGTQVGLMLVPIAGAAGKAAAALRATRAAKYGRDIPFGPASEDAWTVLNRVDAKGAPLPGYRGGKTFLNDGSQGSARLPEGPTYREWDLSPNVKGVPRDARRLVTGSDGSAYYTTDHYLSFIQFRR